MLDSISLAKQEAYVEPSATRDVTLAPIFCFSGRGRTAVFRAYTAAVGSPAAVVFI